MLGPVLFLVFINDLDQGIASNILKFADDTKIFKKVRDNTDSEALQRDLDNVVLWAQKWQMEFNIKKCKVMHIGRQIDCCEYYLGGSKLVEETFRERLGSLDLGCSQQCRYAVIRLTRC